MTAKTESGVDGCPHHLIAGTDQNDPPNNTNRHERLFVVIRVISWIVPVLSEGPELTAFASRLTITPNESTGKRYKVEVPPRQRICYPPYYYLEKS